MTAVAAANVDLPVGAWAVLPGTARAELALARGPHTCRVVVERVELALAHPAPGELVLTAELALDGLRCRVAGHPSADDGLLVPWGAPALALRAGHCVLTPRVLVAPCVLTVGSAGRAVELSGPVLLAADGGLEVDLGASVQLGRGVVLPAALRDDQLDLRLTGHLRRVS